MENRVEQVKESIRYKVIYLGKILTVNISTKKGIATKIRMHSIDTETHFNSNLEINKKKLINKRLAGAAQLSRAPRATNITDLGSTPRFITYM